MPRRYFSRVDSNQTALVKVLRKLGLRVHVWNSEADLICQLGGLTVLCEVRAEKGGTQTARKGRQEKFQRDFMVRWIRTPEDCLELRNVLLAWSKAIQREI